MNRKLAEYVAGWSDGAATYQPPTDLPEPWALEERLSPDRIEHVLIRYASGASSQTLADELGVGKTALIRLLRDHGVQIRRRGPQRT